MNQQTKLAVYPGLYYAKAMEAMAWLEDAFGFKRRLVVPGPDDSIIHAELSLGDAVVMLGTERPDSEWVSPLSLSGVNMVVSVWVDDPDTHYEAAKASGAEIIQELQDTPFGARLYVAKDLEGHHWCFSDYRPGAYWENDEK